MTKQVTYKKLLKKINYMETERIELSSGMGYKPASTCVGLLISVKLRHEPFL